MCPEQSDSACHGLEISIGQTGHTYIRSLTDRQGHIDDRLAGLREPSMLHEHLQRTRQWFFPGKFCRAPAEYRHDVFFKHKALETPFQLHVSVHSERVSTNTVVLSVTGGTDYTSHHQYCC